MLDNWIGQTVVIDLRSQFVAIGTLKGFDELFIELKNADLHDLRDTETTRELYVAESRATGVKRNRRHVLVVRSDMVAIARLEDVVDE
jgi:small nuclear ribonucleoprotein (snRNP)-like protein